MKKYAILLIFAAICVLLCSCTKQKQVENKVDIWKLTSTSPDDKYGTYLGNGFISTQVKGEGFGNQDGQALACYMAGLYSQEKIVRMPDWSDIRLMDQLSEFKLDKSSDYRQVLDMKQGVLTTSGSWKTSGKSLKGDVRIVVSRDKAGLALITMEFTPDFSGKLTVQQTLAVSSDQLIPASAPAVRPGPGVRLWRIKDTSGPKNIACAGYIGTKEAYKSIVSTLPEGGFAADIDMVKNQPIKIEVWISWHRGADLVQTVTSAREQLLKVLPESSDTQTAAQRFVAEHASAWESLWQRDIVVGADEKTQQIMHSNLFYLLQSVREQTDYSIAPMGLSNNSFNGHIFWDADTWMFPTLLLQHPDLARSIVDYRFKTLPGALKNAVNSGYKGAQFAWESGETGIEDAPTGIAYVEERHINSDVALAQWQYYLASADKAWLGSRGYPVISATADYWVSRVKLVNGRYEILAVVPPDENAGPVDNSVYTNAGAKLNLLIAAKAAQELGRKPNPAWQKVADKIYIPFDKVNNHYIARDKYTDQILKQSDPELVIYPLQMFPNGGQPDTVSKNTYEKYAPKVNANGPAMSSSIHSIISARLGNTEEALEKFHASYQPFMRGSFNYFNEKRSKTYQNACFLTGAAGSLQAIQYGFAGVRMQYLPESAAGYELTTKPNLPKEWKSVTLKKVVWRGKTFDISYPEHK